MKKRTQDIIKCLEIVADQNHKSRISGLESIYDYFCPTTAIVIKNRDKNYLVDFFDSLYSNDSFKKIKRNFRKNRKSGSCYTAEEKFKTYGFFGNAENKQNQNHRLMAIAFAAAVSETEK